MAGCIIPRTPIAVDFWRRRDISQVKLFFLSHMHSDHTACLSSTWSQKIYCSEITKGLAIEKFKINPSLLIVLPTGQSSILPLDEDGTEKLTVTPIDANHCPGAVMFLFEGYFGRILYTADFRYYDGLLDNPLLSNDMTINRLYLDNTYCDALCEFPTKAEATMMVMTILSKHPTHDVVFGLDNLGKEELLYKVAMVLGVNIVVSRSFRFKTTQLMGIDSVFTTDPDASRIRVVQKRDVNDCKLHEWNRTHPTIAILPTCLYQAYPDPFRNSENIFTIPYSDHSSFSELKTFVAGIKPQEIIPIVTKPSKDRIPDSRSDMAAVFDKEKSDSSSQFFEIPKSVQGFMSLNVTLPWPTANKKKKKHSRKKAKKASGIVFPSPNKKKVGGLTGENVNISDSGSHTMVSPDDTEMTSPSNDKERPECVQGDEEPQTKDIENGILSMNDTVGKSGNQMTLSRKTGVDEEDSIIDAMEDCVREIEEMETWFKKRYKGRALKESGVKKTEDEFENGNQSEDNMENIESDQEDQVQVEEFSVTVDDQDSGSDIVCGGQKRKNKKGNGKRKSFIIKSISDEEYDDQETASNEDINERKDKRRNGGNSVRDKIGFLMNKLDKKNQICAEELSIVDMDDSGMENPKTANEKQRCKRGRSGQKRTDSEAGSSTYTKEVCITISTSEEDGEMENYEDASIQEKKTRKYDVNEVGECQMKGVSNAKEEFGETDDGVSVRKMKLEIEITRKQDTKQMRESQAEGIKETPRFGEAGSDTDVGKKRPEAEKSGKQSSKERKETWVGKNKTAAEEVCNEEKTLMEEIDDNQNYAEPTTGQGRNRSRDVSKESEDNSEESESTQTMMDGMFDVLMALQESSVSEDETNEVGGTCPCENQAGKERKVAKQRPINEVFKNITLRKETCANAKTAEVFDASDTINVEEIMTNENHSKEIKTDGSKSTLRESDRLDTNNGSPVKTTLTSPQTSTPKGNVHGKKAKKSEKLAEGRKKNSKGIDGICTDTDETSDEGILMHVSPINASTSNTCTRQSKNTQENECLEQVTTCTESDLFSEHSRYCLSCIKRRETVPVVDEQALKFAWQVVLKLEAKKKLKDKNKNALKSNKPN